MHREMYILLLSLLVAAAAAADVHVLITTYGSPDLGRSPLCMSLGETMPFACTIAGVAGYPALTCPHLAHCANATLPDTRNKNRNIRAQEALVAGAAPWFLIIKPSYRVSAGWAAEVRALTEQWAGACEVGACVPYNGVLDHVNHKALVNAACYRALMPRLQWWDEREEVDVSMTNAMLESGARFVCDPRFNGHLLPGPDDILFRSDGWHKISRVAGEFPFHVVVEQGKQPH
jgi:hypothetical protein